MTALFDIAPAAPGDIADVVALLRAAGLPSADVTADGPVRILAAHDGGRLVGAVGLETYGPSGLLRSLVVTPDARGTGLGGQLVTAIEDDARAHGLVRLYLLTETAEPFFAARSYVPVARADVPGAVSHSSQFAALCPASAACLTKPLSP